MNEYIQSASPESPASPEIAAIRGSHDGNGAADNDAPYTFGRRPRSIAPYPFSTRQYARLLALRSRVHADRLGLDASA
jgi:hypothetical protein